MADVEAAAHLLVEQRRKASSVSQLPPALRPVTLAEGYRIQDRVVALLGEAVLGWRVEAAAPEVRRAFGLSEPISGRLLAGAVQEYPATVAYEDLASRPSLGCEVVFRLGRALRPEDAPFDAAAVRGAVAKAAPAICVLASRFDNAMAVGAPSLVADNAAAALLVLGDPVDRAGVDPATVSATLRINGEITAKGAADAVMGDPYRALAWLGNHLAARRITLEQGALVATGTMTGLWTAQPEDVALADFGRFGRVSVHVTG
jgi:2-keto-4-pentenoate hydratase